MEQHEIVRKLYNPKFGQIPSGYDDFTFSSKPIKTPKIFSRNNNMHNLTSIDNLISIDRLGNHAIASTIED